MTSIGEYLIGTGQGYMVHRLVAVASQASMNAVQSQIQDARLHSASPALSLPKRARGGKRDLSRLRNTDRAYQEARRAWARAMGCPVYLSLRGAVQAAKRQTERTGIPHTATSRDQVWLLSTAQDSAQVMVHHEG